MTTNLVTTWVLHTDASQKPGFPLMLRGVVATQPSPLYSPGVFVINVISRPLHQRECLDGGAAPVAAAMPVNAVKP
jgi:hypothetical protein